MVTISSSSISSLTWTTAPIALNVIAGQLLDIPSVLARDSFQNTIGNAVVTIVLFTDNACQTNPTGTVSMQGNNILQT